MRVAIPFEQCWLPVPGGTARSTLDLAHALDDRGDVEVVGVSAWHRHPAPEPWRTHLPVRPVPLPRRVLWETWHALSWPRVESVTGPVDLVHAVGGAVPATRCPLVVTVHDLAFRHLPGAFTANGRRFFGRALALTRRRAAQVQVPSQATWDDCVDAGIPEERLRLVPWGCAIVRPDASTIAAVRAGYGLPERYVVAVGTREPRKNLDRLVRAWLSLGRTDAGLVLVGPRGWGGDVGALGPFSSRFNEQVTMTGFVDSVTRDALYAGATASCYPSLFEGFGLPVLESMALGCPVITSRGTATEELVRGGAGLLVDPRDEASIAEALAAMLDDEVRRDALAAAGLARAAQYTWDRAADAASAGYSEVVG